jgi:hypothetical protein
MYLQTQHSWIEQDEGLLLIISSNQLDRLEKGF